MTGATVSLPAPRLTLGRWALGATAVLFGVATLNGYSDVANLTGGWVSLEAEGGFDVEKS